MNTVFIISWPSWVGKTTIWHSAESMCSEFVEKIITTTTRSIREGEIQWVHYHFVTRGEFEDYIHKGNLIEYALVHGNYYWSTFWELERIVEWWKCPLYIIDPQWMVHIRPVLEGKWYMVKSIFLLPPSLDELKNRLWGRWTESDDAFQLRYANALIELEDKDYYDYQIVNDDIEETTQKILDIIRG